MQKQTLGCSPSTRSRQANTVVHDERRLRCFAFSNTDEAKSALHGKSRLCAPDALRVTCHPGPVGLLAPEHVFRLASLQP